MPISDGELNRLRAGEEESAAEECSGEVPFRLLAPRVFLAGESVPAGESEAGGFLAAAAARIVFLDGETGGKEGDFALTAPRVFLAGESTAAVAAAGPLREGDRPAAAAPRAFLPGELIEAAGSVFEGDFTLAFLRVFPAGESSISGGGGDPAPPFFEGLVPAPALGGGLDFSCDGLLGGVFRGGAGG